jgi:dTDP-glucose 4,6-dehydratase
MNNRAILITGGAGFIGSNFVRLALNQTDSPVVVVDKFTYAGHPDTLADVAKHPRFSLVRADIADLAAMHQVFEAHSPTAVVNFAAETHVDRSIDGPAAFVQTNIVGTFALLEASRALIGRLSAEDSRAFRYLQVSTDEVYGTLGPEGKFTEQTPYAPNSPYSASKASADHLVRAYVHTYGLNAVVTNCSNNYGPYQFPEKLLPLMILNAVSAKPLPIYGTGKNVRDWLFVGDHCEGILKALIRGRAGEKYNFGGDSERTNVEVVDAICASVEKVISAAKNQALIDAGVRNYTDLKTFVADRPGHDLRYAIDASKAHRELDWKPSRTFEQGLAETVEWYLQNTAWCHAVQHGRYDRERLGLSMTASLPTQKSGEKSQ